MLGLVLSSSSQSEETQILYGFWVIKLDTVDDTHKHGKAACHIFKVVKHNVLLNHNSYLEDLPWKGILFSTFTAYQQAMKVSLSAG